MKKLIIALFLGFAFTNIGFAGYGEDMKGECVKGKDSSRGQEVVVQGQTAASDSESKQSGNKTKKK